MGTYCKNSVQKHNALVRPFFQIAVIWYVTAKIIVKFLINIHQGRRDIYIRLYGKTQSMCLAVVVVWILAKDHDFYICQWCKRKCIENIIRRRKYLAGLIFVKYGII